LFISVPLVSSLPYDHKSAIVGNLRRNRREIPAEIMDAKGRHMAASLFLFDKYMMMMM
jgi:hypothetical protein